MGVLLKRWLLVPGLVGVVCLYAAFDQNAGIHSWLRLRGELRVAEREIAESRAQIARLGFFGDQERFGGEDPHFVYTIPSKALASKITRPKSIKGQSTAVEITDWSEVTNLVDRIVNN